MSASIVEVARLAGVSTATVSRALRGLPNVAALTKGRVLDAAQELGYVATPSARVLATGRTRTVAVVAPYLTRWYVGQVVDAAGDILAGNGYHVLLYNLSGQQGRRRFFEGLPLRKRVDACLLMGLALTDDETARLRSLGIPVALVGVAHEQLPHVRIDDVAGAARAVQHLVDLGHERIGLIGGDARPMALAAPADRRAGYRQALEGAGLGLDPALEAPGHFSFVGGGHAMSELLASRRPPTAVFAESDEMALGAVRTARRTGLRVPEDVSIVGFDDHEMAELMDLTTVSQPARDQGVLAAMQLLGAVERGDPFPAGTILPTRLVVRGSSARPPGRRSGRLAARTG
ncbi:MAG: LacI family DNA-binding transcriptional regulator [Frankiaceae bacterium]